MKIKLNLGCGYNYKPGYINIDKYNKDVADEIYDIDNLPFESNTVDIIEANQLIEHFDYIHSKYILSDWFRILKPLGKLILETPDLERTYKKFISEDLDDQKITLRWIYGIDSRGMQHKTGFTYNLIKELLEEIGFGNITEKEQITHKYEHGLRIICEKPQNSVKNHLVACFRKSLMNKLNINDSFVLIPLEDWLITAIEKYNNEEGWLNALISQTIICTPQIPLIFIEECISAGILKQAEIETEIKFLGKLAENEFHKKVFSLWMKKKKNIGELESEFKEFINHLEKLILDVLNYPEDYTQRLSYILNLEPNDIKIFDFELILLQADKLFNIGIKNFHKKNFTQALDCFLKSSRLNPDNYLIYWNIARLGCILDFENHKIILNYEKALTMVQDKVVKEKIELELKESKNKKRFDIPRQPITE
ncbi:MAG: methyltransferase domain-containing protein [Candidatus Helarchaeota archaeon]|nr:methyltransferase domain-containing protein [Candidatus Helarchaeota archaeon]